ncbi:MAG: hypothetical protein HOQ05_11075 [Corynebacteriales bacterium]|nr:hypothetical protein [Mycobacteriales bacterium]
MSLPCFLVTSLSGSALLADAATCAASGQLEDNQDAAGVFQDPMGRTVLYAIDGVNIYAGAKCVHDTKWHVRALEDGLRIGALLADGEPRLVLREAIEHVRDIHACGISDVDHPAAAMMVAVVEGLRVRSAGLADTSLIVVDGNSVRRFSDDRHTRACENPENVELWAAWKRQHAQWRTVRSLDERIALLKRVERPYHEVRNRIDLPDRTFWLASIEPIAADYAITTDFKVRPGATLIVSTDGLESKPIDWPSSVQKLHVDGAAAFLRHVRKMRGDIGDGIWPYPHPDMSISFVQVPLFSD